MDKLLSIENIHDLDDYNNNHEKIKNLKTDAVVKLLKKHCYYGRFNINGIALLSRLIHHYNVPLSKEIKDLIIESVKTSGYFSKHFPVDGYILTKISEMVDNHNNLAVYYYQNALKFFYDGYIINFNLLKHIMIKYYWICCKDLNYDFNVSCYIYSNDATGINDIIKAVIYFNNSYAADLVKKMKLLTYN